MGMSRVLKRFMQRPIGSGCAKQRNQSRSAPHKKRPRTGALQNASRILEALRPMRQLLECGCPLPLFQFVSVVFLMSKFKNNFADALAARGVFHSGFRFA